MVVQHLQCSSKRFHLQLWSRPLRWLSALALVVALSGLTSIDAQAGAPVQAVSTTDGSQVTFAGPLNRLDVLQDDMDNEEEEEEFEEDGLLPTGQAEQRAQGLGDKAEARDEDHDN